MTTFSVEQRIEALTIAMSLAPGVYTRNRMFDFFGQEFVQRARTRASVLRGIVPQVGRASGLSITREGRGEGHVFVLRYAVTSLRLSRVVELTPAELSALRVLAERSGIVTLPVAPEDSAAVDAALARLMTIGEGAELARAARGAVCPPAP